MVFDAVLMVTEGVDNGNTTAVIGLLTMVPQLVVISEQVTTSPLTSVLVLKLEVVLPMAIPLTFHCRTGKPPAPEVEASKLMLVPLQTLLAEADMVMTGCRCDHYGDTVFS
jgi:hypothetical protein